MKDFYYESCDLYGDIRESTTLLAHSTDVWTLCDIPPDVPIDIPPDLHDSFADDQVLEDNQRMAYQGMLDRCSDLNVFETDIELAQKALKPSICPPASDDWERKRKYFAYIPAKLVRNTFKHSTQHGVLPPSSHLQKRFKSPNPLLNLHQRNKADATDQIFSDTPASLMKGEISK